LLATFAVGIVHLLVFLAAQRVAAGYYRPMLFFACFLLLGLLLFVAAWVGWKPAVHRGFPLALIGSVAWSIVSWECTAYLAFARARKVDRHFDSPNIGKADQFLVLAVPVIIAGIVGGIFALTNPYSLFLSDRIEDFLNVARLGVGCSLFLALPWFCLAFALREKERGS
jgi:hypothetical protein